MVLVVKLVNLIARSKAISEFANLSSLSSGMVAGVQYFELKCRVLFDCCAEGGGEAKFGRITNCCVEDCVVAHRIHTTDLVP